MKLKLALGCFMLFMSCFSTVAQFTTVGTADNVGNNVKNMVNIIPPSPDAFSITRYGNLPIGLFTGAAQYSLPVYSVTSGRLIHNISINYSTNGIKVDEMSSRVGVSWVLNAGGTITRTVLDVPDEFSYRTFYHGEEEDTSGTFYQFVKQTTYGTPPDYQPDEYSFSVNGMSGKFFKREDGSFRILSASKIKIEVSGGGFLLTGTDGTKYYFGLYEMTKNVNPIEPTAPQNVPNYVATSWHLTKIKSHTNDSIVFNYSSLGADTLLYVNGISEELSTNNMRSGNVVVFQYNEMSQPGVLEELHPECRDPECFYFRTNVEMTKTVGKYLSSIDFHNGRVEFVVSPRQDIEHEVRVDSIRIIRAPDERRIKTFALDYFYAQYSAGTYDTYGPSSTNLSNSYYGLRKRLFLSAFKQVAVESGSEEVHHFEYEDPNGLPPRLSFSQDKFGFFNGKVNTYFVPNDTWWDWWIGGTNWGGDRNYDFTYAKKGALKKIVYPTGGVTIITYEPNKINGYYLYKMNDSYITQKNVDTSISYMQTVYSDSFQAVSGKELMIKASCNWASVAPYWFPESYWAELKIVNASDNSDACCNVRLDPGDTTSYFATNLIPGNYYKLKILATQARLKVKTSIHYAWKTIDTSENVGIGGIRVKAIVDSADEVTESNRREFYYRDWEYDNCSGKGLYYYPDGRNFVSVERKFARLSSAGLAQNADEMGARWYSGNNVLRSSSVRNMYLNETGSVTYSKVIELNHSTGNTNNGGIEYQFENTRKSAASAFSNNKPHYIWNFSPFQVSGYPFNNDEFFNGLPISTKYFTYQTKFGSRTILKEEFQYHSLEELSKDSFYAVKNVLPLVSGMPQDPFLCGDFCHRMFSFFDVNKYYRTTGWIKLDSTVEKQYSGTDVLVSKVEYTYTSNNYKVATATYQNSDGLAKQTSYLYPGTISSSDPDYYNMTLQNILDPVVYSISSKNNQLKSQQTYFDQFSISGNTFYQPASVTSKVNSLSPDTELTIQQYDAKGNILQYVTRDGITNSVIWGYDGNYPVAKVQGADHSSCMAVLNSTVLNNPSSDHALRAELHRLRTQVSGTVFVSTLTYSPLVGVTSESDFNNKTTYYEYDNFNRLKIIRDQDSNIVKRICYNFKGQQTECAESHTFPATPCNAHNCPGYDRKCIEGNCVQSTTLILVSSEDMGNGTWKCTYAYTFNNGTITGQEFIEYQQTGFGCLIPL